MARKTRKQKVKASLKIEKRPEVLIEKSPVNSTHDTVLSAEDKEEARITKRGIMKTLILIAVLFMLQAGVFIAKSKGMLPF